MSGAGVMAETRALWAAESAAACRGLRAPQPVWADSVMGEGRRIPLNQAQRRLWLTKMDALPQRLGMLGIEAAAVMRALLSFHGPDGQCDPTHASLSERSGCSVSTVQRLLKWLQGLGFVSWTRRKVMAQVGPLWRAEQTSNAYCLHVDAELPSACDGQRDRGSRSKIYQALTASARLRRFFRQALGRPAVRQEVAVGGHRPAETPQLDRGADLLADRRAAFEQHMRNVAGMKYATVARTQLE